MDTFVVSPVNARDRLSEFIKGAKSELLIYDPEVADPAIARILNERCEAGVRIRVLGRLSGKVSGSEVSKLYIRLHTRMIVRDGEDVFLGSQSLRTAELDARREVGIIFREPKIAARLIETFEDDWKESVKDKTAEHRSTGANPPVRKVARKVAKTVANVLPPVAPVLEVVVRELAGPKTEVDIDAEELEATVKDAVKTAIQEAVANAVKQAATHVME
jgi:phosphatidylserine/phosphatidylglycerophosphate/cardiolipin synthase-like enzyme